MLSLSGLRCRYGPKKHGWGRQRRRDPRWAGFGPMQVPLWPRATVSLSMLAVIRGRHMAKSRQTIRTHNVDCVTLFVRTVPVWFLGSEIKTRPEGPGSVTTQREPHTLSPHATA